TLCDDGVPQNHSTSRRDFLKATAATGIAAAGTDLFTPGPAGARDRDEPEDTGRHERRYVIRGGAVMSLDPAVGDFPEADVLVEGKKIVAVGPHLQARAARSTTFSTSFRPSRPCTGRTTSTSARCSARSASSITASRRCTTSRRSITRPSTPTPPSRASSIRADAPPSATS